MWTARSRQNGARKALAATSRQPRHPLRAARPPHMIGAGIAEASDDQYFPGRARAGGGRDRRPGRRKGRCRQGSIWPGSRSSRRAIRRMATSPPMPRWCWRAPSNKTRWRWPSELPPAMMARELRPAITAATGSPSPPARPGLSEHPAGTRGLARATARRPARRHWLWRLARWVPASGSMSSMSRPIRPGRCMSATAAAPWSATRSRRCSPRPGSRSIASITSTTPAPRSISWPARSTCATARRWAKKSARFPRGSTPANIWSRPAGPWPSATVGNGSGRPESEWLGAAARFRVEEMMALIRDDLAALGVRHDTFASERRAGRSRGDRRMPRRARPARADLYRRPRAAQGQDPRGLGAAAADPVPRDPIRRRCRPAAQEIGRLVDLFRRRHRLSPRQIPPRLCQSDRCLGRRSRRLCQAHAGGGAGGDRRRARRSTSRSASWSICSTRARRCACRSAPAPSSRCARSSTRSARTSSAS